MSGVQDRVDFFERLTSANAAAKSPEASSSTPEKEKEARRASLAAAANNNATDNPKIKLLRRLGKLGDGSTGSNAATSSSAAMPLLNFRPARQPTTESVTSPSSNKPAAGKRSTTTAKFTARASSKSPEPSPKKSQPPPATSSASSNSPDAARAKQQAHSNRQQQWRSTRKGREDGDEKDRRESSVPKEIPAWAHPVGTQQQQQHRATASSSSSADVMFQQDEEDPCPVDVLWDMVLRSTVFKDNEIKLRRQVALWECCERKLRSGSYVEPPFATDPSCF